MGSEDAYSIDLLLAREDLRPKPKGGARGVYAKEDLTGRAAEVAVRSLDQLIEALNDPDDETRLASAHLIHLACKASGDIRNRVLELFPALAREHSRPAILTLLAWAAVSFPMNEAHLPVVEALAEAVEPRTTGLLVFALASASDPLSSASADALRRVLPRWDERGWTQKPKPRMAIVADFMNATRQRLDRVVEVLVDAGNDLAVEALLKIAEMGATQRLAVRDVVGRAGHPATREALEGIASRHPQAEEECARLLVWSAERKEHVPNERAIRRLVAMGSEAVDSLLRRLEGDQMRTSTDRDRAALAATILGEIGDVRAVGRLSEIVRHKIPYPAKNEAAEALLKIGTREAREAILDGLGEESWDIGIVRAAGKLDDPRAFTSLLNIFQKLKHFGDYEVAGQGLMRLLKNQPHKIDSQDLRRLIDAPRAMTKLGERAREELLRRGEALSPSSEASGGRNVPFEARE